MHDTTALQRYGWTPELAAEWEQYGDANDVPGRAVADYGGFIVVATPHEYKATVAGKLRHELSASELPKVGDWVAVRPEDSEVAVIQRVLTRTSAVERKANSSRPEKQVLAANVDIAFVVQSLNGDFNLARLNRYAFQLEQSGIQPIFIFNKIDLVSDRAAFAQIEEWGKRTFFTNARAGEGVKEICELIKGKTAVFVGSSGVGKSTLVNMLLGEERQKTGTIRDDDRGRHTTSHRELFVMPSGGVIIDTPGIRELQLWGEEGSLEAVFPDIIELAQKCQFRNCRHTPKEKGCAVQRAVKERKLSSDRLGGFLKLRDELTVDRYA